MNEIYYGTTGKILRVNLTNERIWEEKIDAELLEQFVGGTSLGVRLLYDKVAPAIKWSDPKNVVYIGSGPLGGTKMAGTGAFSVVTKGAVTNGVASSQANGFFGAYLKTCGFDGILIEGAGTNWKYLVVDEGTAELKEAKGLLGLDTWTLEDKVREALGHRGKKDSSVCGIGPAGESLVKFAGIFCDKGHSASHNGVGAVLGSKRLKAIAVTNTRKEVRVFDPEGIVKVNKELLEKFKKALGGLIFETGTSKLIGASAKGGVLPVKNYTTNVFPDPDDFYTRDKYKLSRHPCWRCPSSHVMHVKIESGPYAGFYGKDPEYEQSAGYGPQIGNQDLAGMIVLANEGDRLGLDANECCWILGWVMECYEKGLLTSKELGGLEMTWGSVENSKKLMNDIAYRRGFGEVLAEGIKSAAESVGGEASKLAIFTEKGNTPRMHDHRSKWWEMVDTCVSESATLQNQLLLLDLTPYGLDPIDQHSWEDVAVAEGKTAGTLTFIDSLVTCWFTCSGDLPLLAQGLNAATGWGFNFDECLKVGRRAINLMRVYNILCGMSPEQEHPSEKYGSVPIDGPAAGLSISDHWESILRKYYKLMGWDENTGLPGEDTLKELGLVEAGKLLNEYR